MDINAIISKYASIAMLGVFALFVIFGMLYGMIRGFKRSLLRLVLYVGLLVAVFFLTPIVTNALLNLNVNIAGRTPHGWIDFLGDKIVVFLKEEFGKYVAPFGSYLMEFSVALVLAIVNLVLFLVLYFILKFISWIIYSIVAHFWAPKKDRMGNKIPKKVGAGLLIGALQGVALFLFFMLPINGVLGVVHQAAIYQNAQTEAEIQTQSVAAASTSEENGAMNIGAVFENIDGALGVYNNVMKYTGLQFLSDRAFEYQLTIRMEGAGSINLVHDISSAWELYVDSQAVGPVFNKIGRMFSEQNYTLLTEKDYDLLRGMTNKVFDLQLLKLADWFLEDLDEVLKTPFDEEDMSYLEGTEIYKNSIYGVLVEQCATEREVEVGANNYNEFAKSIRAVVQYVADKKLGLIKNDLLGVIDLGENLDTYKVQFKGDLKTVAAALSEDDLSWRDYLDLATARLAVAQGKHTVGTPIIDVLGSDLHKFSLVKMLGLTDMEKLVVYSNFCDALNDDDLENLVYGMAASFLGEKAYTKGEVQGSWDKLGDVLFDLAEVINQNDSLINDLSAIMSSENPEVQSLIGKIGELIITEEYYEAHKDEFGDQAYGDAIKYQKVDTLVNGIHRAINAFEPVKTFLTAQLNKMGEDNELFEMIQDLMNASVEEWENKFHSLVSAANLMNNEVMSDLMDKLENSSGELGTEDIAQVLDVIQKEMDAETVTAIIDTVVSMPEVGDAMKDGINNALAEILPENKDATSAVLEEIFEPEEKDKEAQASLETLQQYLNNETDIETGEPVVSQEDFKTAIDDLLNLVGDTDLSAWLGGAL